MTLCTITVEFYACIEMQDALDPMDPIFALIRKSVIMMAVTPTAALPTLIERSTREGTLTPKQSDDFVLR